MSISGVKKATILKKNLPPVSPQNEYYLRYRITSDIGDRKSHWSPLYKIPAKDVIAVEGAVSFTTGGITAVWGDEADRPAYDVFVRFSTADYYYHGTTPIHTYSFLATGTGTVQVAVQVEGVQKERNELLEIYESEVISLV
jgi:hypothetical protein